MQNQLPEAIPQEINISNIMALTARLAQILAQEVDSLSAMKIKELEPLQKEKNWLTKALDMQLRRVRKYPNLLDSVAVEEREELSELVAIFEEIREENYRRLLAAKEANQCLVEAITEVVNEQNRKPTYTEEGQTEPQHDSLSITLNKTI